MIATDSPVIFNGTYTIENVLTGEYRTLRIKTQKADASFAPSARILSVLTGPDNEASYTSFAFVREGKAIVWNSKRGQHGKRSNFEGYAFMLEKAIAALATEADDGAFNIGERDYKVTRSKRCLSCNRKLTTPESLARGFGPECAARIGLS